MAEERKKYEDGWTDTEKVDGGQSQQAVVNTPPQERGIYNVGITYDQIKDVADVGEGGGTKLYRHTLSRFNQVENFTLEFISTFDTPLNNENTKGDYLALEKLRTQIVSTFVSMPNDIATSSVIFRFYISNVGYYYLGIRTVKISDSSGTDYNLSTVSYTDTVMPL